MAQDRSAELRALHDLIQVLTSFLDAIDHHAHIRNHAGAEKIAGAGEDGWSQGGGWNQGGWNQGGGRSGRRGIYGYNPSGGQAGGNQRFLNEQPADPG